MLDPQTKFAGRLLGAPLARPLLRPVATHSKASVAPWPVNAWSGPLQFWRLSRRLELQRDHGRLLVHGNGYWK